MVCLSLLVHRKVAIKTRLWVLLNIMCFVYFAFMTFATTFLCWTFILPYIFNGDKEKMRGHKLFILYTFVNSVGNCILCICSNNSVRRLKKLKPIDGGEMKDLEVAIPPTASEAKCSTSSVKDKTSGMPKQQRRKRIKASDNKCDREDMTMSPCKEKQSKDTTKSVQKGSNDNGNVIEEDKHVNKRKKDPQSKKQKYHSKPLTVGDQTCKPIKLTEHSELPNMNKCEKMGTFVGEAKSVKQENFKQKLSDSDIKFSNKHGQKNGELDNPPVEESQNGSINCVKCKVQSPPRSHHCPLCQTCILKRDHHCFITTVCIGYHNQKYFVMYCFYMTLGTLYGMVLIAMYLKGLFNVTFHGPQTFFTLIIDTILLVATDTHPGLGYVVLVIMLYGCLCAGLMSAGFWFWQCQIIYSGQTSKEAMRGVLTFSGSCLGSNFRDVFGRFWMFSLFLPLPLPQCSDGSYLTHLETVKKEQ